MMKYQYMLLSIAAIIAFISGMIWNWQWMIRNNYWPGDRWFPSILIGLLFALGIFVIFLIIAVIYEWQTGRNPF
jgi:hypothetical protein